MIKPGIEEQRRGRELRRARAAAGLSQEDLGKSINYSGSLVSAVENGQRPPTRDYLVAVDAALDTGGLFERLLNGLVSIDKAPVWFRDWVIIEREATMIRWFEPLIVPGLLQTKDYAHAIIAGSGVVDSSEVDDLVTARLERQALLATERPPTLIAIIDEGVLRRCIGTPPIMAEQCQHLLDCGSRPHLHIHVVPASVGVYAGLGGAFILAKARDFEAAHIYGQLHAQTKDGPRDIDRLARAWEVIRSEALPRSLSHELIKEVGRTWLT
jgi:transcriptional regulator with XRE-family HTH domain